MRGKPRLTIAGRLGLSSKREPVQSEMGDAAPGAVVQPHHAHPDAGLIVQEDKGEDLARRPIA